VIFPIVRVVLGLVFRDAVTHRCKPICDNGLSCDGAGWFVDQVMNASQGKANPQAVNALLRKRLGV